MAAQWTLKVKITAIDAETIRGKSKWNVGDFVTIQIEPHATINMLKQRIALIVMAHDKFQEISFPEGTLLDNMTKMENVEGLKDGGTLFVSCKVPPEPELPPVVLSDDEGLYKGEEPDLPEAPSKEILTKELSDEDMDKQCKLKEEAQDALEDGDLNKAVTKFTEAMMLGSTSAMMVAKRAEMLLKQKRYHAAIADATLALEINPDSAKGYRARGKARRFLGEYEGSAADLSLAQKIDYDDSVADIHSYVQKRHEKMQLKKKQEEQAAAKAASA